MRRRRVCFVTGTRAEFGLMRGTLDAIRAHPRLRLQLVVTGMHLDQTRGRTAVQIPTEGFRIDRVIPWPTSRSRRAAARQTGIAMSRLADVFSELRSDLILIVGDRVEAFAAAAAAHIAGCIVAHVHGGDRALGQVDDSLRHAITKLAHLHFPATRQSARRIVRLGEDSWRIHRVGAPGLDTLAQLPRQRTVRRSGAVILLHPVDSDERAEFDRARTVIRAVQSVSFEQIAVIYPNTDPGAGGIVRCWQQHARGPGCRVYPNLSRHDYLQMLRNAVVLVGNSSSGIIEAASLGTPVVDIGPRQSGRERSRNVTQVGYNHSQIHRALSRIWNSGRPRRFRGENVYGGGGTGRKIAQILAGTPLQDPIRRKLIAY